MTAAPTELRSARLLLRRWRADDRAPFAAMNADPAVMEYYPSTLSTQESDAFVERIEERFDSAGFGLWAVEIEPTAAFAGYVGLWPATFDADFTPAVEIGWRLTDSVRATATPPKQPGWRCPTGSIASVSTRSSRSRRPSIVGPAASWRNWACGTITPTTSITRRSHRRARCGGTSCIDSRRTPDECCDGLADTESTMTNATIQL